MGDLEVVKKNNVELICGLGEDEESGNEDN